MNEKLKELNETELVELCKERGLLVAHRGLGRDTLIGLLTGSVSEDEYTPDPIDEERDLMLYMQRAHSSMILGQLRCGDEHYYCPDCPAGRVVICAVVDSSPSLRKSMQHEMLLERQRQAK